MPLSVCPSGVYVFKKNPEVKNVNIDFFYYLLFLIYLF